MMSKNNTIVVGGGCFWCTEAFYKRIPGVLLVVPGYAGGTKINPSYEEVCSGKTGHAEVVQITYNSMITNLEKLLEVFLAVHDPTTLNQQGADRGTQYRSIILYENNEQKEMAKTAIKNAARNFSKPIVTEIKPLVAFYEAEDYHHDYFAKHSSAPYCQMVISPKLLLYFGNT